MTDTTTPFMVTLTYGSVRTFPGFDGTDIGELSCVTADTVCSASRPVRMTLGDLSPARA